MQGFSIRWLLFGVSAAVLVLPALSLVALRSYTGYLVRRTEEQLLAQGVLVAETFREAWLAESGSRRAPVEPPDEFSPIGLLAERITALSPPEPEALPRAPKEQRGTAAYRAGRSVEPLLRRAQVHNLSAVRVLDGDGCVVATTRGDAERCLGALPEVERALGGSYAAVLRPRVSDEPPPPLTSISRRGDQRLFVALPVRHDGQVIAVVRLSRTAESGLEWIWKNRLPLLGGSALVLGAALALSLVCAGLIARPVERMAKAAAAVATGAPWPAGAGRGSPRELAVLGEALGTMTEKLAARARYVAEFAANVSHELKAPLTSMRGATELLRDAWPSMSEEQRERFLANIRADAERTEALVGGLLHLARIENPAAAPEAEPIELGAVRRALEARYPEHVRLTVDEPEACVTILPEHLESALGNVIDNALRYRQSEPVRVTLGAKDGRLHAEVTDDGHGISAANLPRVFDRFFTTERDLGGTGLGLAIVRAIAEARGGSVECKSSPAGTRFRLVL